MQWVTRVESGVFKNERIFPFQNNLFLNLIFVLNHLKELYVFCFVNFLIASSFMTKKPRNSLSKGCLLDESSNDWLKLMKIHFLSFSFTIYLHVWLICFSSSQNTVYNQGLGTESELNGKEEPIFLYNPDSSNSKEPSSKLNQSILLLNEGLESGTLNDQFEVSRDARSGLHFGIWNWN